MALTAPGRVVDPQPERKDTVQPCPSDCSCSSRWSSPGRSDRPMGAICCDARRTRSPSTSWCWARSARRSLHRWARVRAASAPEVGRSFGLAQGGRGGDARARPGGHRAIDDRRPDLRLRRAPGACVARGPRRRTRCRARRSARSTASFTPIGSPSADPYVHEVSPAQALVIRAGWGEGEQVADGRWLHARELPLPVWSDLRSTGRRRRLRATERRRCVLKSTWPSCSGGEERACCARTSPCARAWTSTRGALPCRCRAGSRLCRGAARAAHRGRQDWPFASRSSRSCAPGSLSRRKPRCPTAPGRPRRRSCVTGSSGWRRPCVRARRRGLV